MVATGSDLFKKFNVRIMVDKTQSFQEQIIPKSTILINENCLLIQKNYCFFIFFWQDLWDLGARRIGVVGLPPMGCLPVVITLYSDNAFVKRGCIDSVSSVAQSYNQNLQIQLNATQNRLAENGARIVYLDAYSPLRDMTSRGQKYG